jgi:hypothetical protein
MTTTLDGYPYIDRILDHLWRYTAEQTGLKFYTILDGARSDKIYPALKEYSAKHKCLFLAHQLLYGGRLPHVLAMVAPYLVELRPGDLFTRWVISRGWGNSWGILLGSTATFSILARHFRRFLMVKNEENEKFYFRYYDPRVLRTYLPTCSKTELNYLFEEVRLFIAEEEGGRRLIEYYPKGTSFGSRFVRLEKSPVPDTEG